MSRCFLSLALAVVRLLVLDQLGEGAGLEGALAAAEEPEDAVCLLQVLPERDPPAGGVVALVALVVPHPLVDGADVRAQVVLVLEGLSARGARLLVVVVGPTAILVLTADVRAQAVGVIDDVAAVRAGGGLDLHLVAALFLGSLVDLAAIMAQQLLAGVTGERAAGLVAREQVVLLQMLKMD